MKVVNVGECAFLCNKIQFALDGDVKDGDVKDEAKDAAVREIFHIVIERVVLY